MSIAAKRCPGVIFYAILFLVLLTTFTLLMASPAETLSYPTNEKSSYVQKATCIIQDKMLQADKTTSSVQSAQNTDVANDTKIEKEVKTLTINDEIENNIENDTEETDAVVYDTEYDDYNNEYTEMPVEYSEQDTNVEYNVTNESGIDFILECSSHSVNSQAAVDAGGIIEYDCAWYVAHNYDAGTIFYEFEIGDVVVIDNREVTIEGYEYFNYAYSVDVVRDQIGYDVVIFQTCIDNNGNVICYYGHDKYNSGPFWLTALDGAHYYGKEIGFVLE